MSMTKKDYELVAKVIAANHRFNLIEDDQLGSNVASITRLMAGELATAFEKDNPDFKRDRFLEECGIEV